MRKLRVKKINRLNEADQNSAPNTASGNTNNAQPTPASGNNASDDKGGIQLKYQDSDNPNMAKMFQNSIAQAYAGELARDTNAVQVKLTASIQGDIQFPTAPSQLASLFLPAQMPKKFMNVYSSYDADPLVTIEQCEDLALKYFNKLDKVQESSKKPVAKEEAPAEAVPENNTDENTEENQDNTSVDSSTNNDNQTPDPSANAPVDPSTNTPVPDPSTGTVSDSQIFRYSRSLNESYGEIAATAAAGGAKGGFAVSKGLGILGSGLAGFLAGLTPAMAGAYGIGYAAGGHGAEHGNWIVDDRELEQKFNEFTTKPDALQKFVCSAIDSYVKDILSLYEQALRHLTSNSKSTEIAKLDKLVVNLLVSRTQNEVTEFVRDNNSMLKEVMKAKTAIIENKFRAQTDFLTRISTMMRNPKFTELGVRPESISAYISTRGKNCGKNRDDYDKISQYMSAFSSKGSEYDEEFKESVKYNSGHVLNEADGPEVQSLPVFDADNIYNSITASIASAVSDILASNSEDWTIVQTARKQMNAMRDAATKEITTSIEHVCRMANGDQSGLSSRLTSFISKHPLRAAKLTNLWARHETDLNTRIEQRIKQISELDGKGPLMMASQLYKNVMPKLIAMMITYKTILTFYTDERFKIPSTVIGEAVTEEQLNTIIQQYKDLFAMQIAQAFALGCSKLTKDGQSPFDLQKGFNDNEMIYLLPWLMCLLNDTNDMESADIKRMGDILKALQTAAQSNDYNTFFSRLSDYLCKECRCGKHEDAVHKISESWSMFDPKQFEEFIQDVEQPGHETQYTALTKMDAHAVYVLMHIIKSKGVLFEKFTSSQQALSGYLNDDITDQKKRMAIFNMLGIEPAKDDEAYATAERLFGKAVPYLQTIFAQGQIDIVQAIRAYYAMDLHKMTDGGNIFPLTRLKIFKDICHNPVMQKLLASDSVIEEYGMIQKLYGEKMSGLESFNKYVAYVTGDDPKLLSMFKFSDMGVNTDEQFNSAVVPALTGFDNDKNVTGTFMQQPDLQAVGWQYQEVTFESVIDKVFASKNKPNPKSLNDLMGWPEEHIGKMQITPEAGQYIKSLLCLELQVLAKYVDVHRNSEQEVKDLWDTDCIPRGTSKVSLSTVCGFIIGLHSGAPDKVKSKIEKIIDNLDNGLIRLLTASMNVNIKPGLFREFMVKNHQMFANSNEFAAYVETYFENNLMSLLSRGNRNTTEGCLTEFVKYMMNPNDYKPVENFLLLHTNRTRAVQNNSAGSNNNSNTNNKPS